MHNQQGRAGSLADKTAVNVAALRSKLAADIHALRAQLADVTSRAEECDNVAALLAELPNRKDNNVMVPLGSAALLPGQLVNASQCLVQVGEPHFLSAVSPGPTREHKSSWAHL